MTGARQMNSVPRSIVILAGIASCAAVNAQPGQGPGNDPSAEKQVLAREEDYTNGILHGDIDLLKSVFADDFVDTGSSGHLRTREEMLALFAQSGRPASIVEKNRRIAVYGSTAVVTVEFIVTTADKQKTETFHGRATDVWVKEYGTWRCVAAHSSEVK